MRNLKRVLSLALALVMMLSLMIVGSSAAEAKKANFTDADEIAYNEAVDVMVALEVIEGTDKGAFNPKGVLTREAAAKIICYMLLGPNNAENLTTNTSIFTDVAAGRWSAGYISYCANLGILAGAGDGTFNPEGQLTGVAFGKMLLVALGYDPAIEGYVGKDWATAIASDMVDADIAVNGVVLSEPLTREQAAQMSFQTLEADMVSYASKGTTVNTTDGTSVIVGASEAKSVEWKDTVKYDDKADGVQQFCEKYFDKLTKADDTDDFGRKGGTWKYKNSEICFSADEPDASFHDRFTYKDLYNALGSGVAKDIADGDITPAYLMNGENNSVSGLWHNNGAAGADYDLAGLYAKRTETKKQLGERGLLVEVYVNDDNDEVTIVMINTYLAQVDGSYDDKDEELDITLLSDNVPSLNSNATTLKNDDFGNLASFEDEDYVLVTVADGDIKTIALAETVTDNVTAYTKGDKVTVGGTTYQYSACPDDDLDVDNQTYAINEDAKLILDPYGFIIGLAEVESSNSYVFLKEFDESGSFKDNYIADAFFADGTHETITLDRVDGEKIKDLAGKVSENYFAITNDENHTFYAGWYTYTVKDGKYRVVPADYTKPDVATKNATAISAASAKVTENGKATIRYNDGSDRTILGTSSTVFVIKDGSDVDTYTGIRNVPDVTTAAAAGTTITWVAANKDGYATYVFIDKGNGTVKNASSKASDIIFVLEDDTDADVGKDNKDNDIWTYEAIVNGTKKNVIANSASVFKDGTNGSHRGLYEDVSYDSDGYVDDVNKINASVTDEYIVQSVSGKVVTFSNGTLAIDGQDYVLNSDAIIRLIENKDVTNMTGSSLATKFNGKTTTVDGAAAVKKLTGTVYAVLDDDGYVKQLYVDATSVTTAAVKAVYETTTAFTDASITTVTPPSTIAGVAVNLTSATDANKMTTIKTALDADATLSAAYNITLSNGTITLTAKTGGVIASDPADFTEATEGKAAVAAKYSFTATKSGAFVENDTVNGKTVKDTVTDASNQISTEDANKLTVAQLLAGQSVTGGTAPSGYTGAIDGAKYVYTQDTPGAVASGAGVTDAAKPSNITIGGVTLSFGSVANDVEGKNAIAAVYTLAADDVQLGGKSLTAHGKTYAVTGANLKAQLESWAAKYNADAGNTVWEASVNAAGNKIVFTAKTAGAAANASAPTGTTQVTAGADS